MQRSSSATTNPETWQLAAGESLLYTIPVTSQRPELSVRCLIGGIPGSWAKVLYRRSAIQVRIVTPVQTPPEAFPVSIALSDRSGDGHSSVYRFTLVVTHAPSSHRTIRRLHRASVTAALALLIVGFTWLAFSLWNRTSLTGVHEQPPSAASTLTSQQLDLPPVPIAAVWSAGVATPTPGSTPTMLPTPTPLPPLPTPQPPPAVSESSNPARGIANSVDTPYTYQLLFQEVGAQFGIDWRLLASIADSESSLNPDAVGRSGEQGMMQMMPDTWSQFAPPVGETNPFDAYASARVSAYFLTYLRDYLYSQGYTETYWLLVAYNWGPNNLRAHLAAGEGWDTLPSVRQNYAYAIIDRVNNASLPLWSERLLAEVPR